MLADCGFGICFDWLFGFIKLLLLLIVSLFVSVFVTYVYLLVIVVVSDGFW